MTTLSKFFAEHISSRSCQDILHSEKCIKHLKNDILLYVLSNFKYFAPICLLPLLTKIKKLNKKELRKTLEYYFGCSLVGTTIGFSINLLICLIRNIYGQFSYYSFGFIPTVLGANLLCLGSDRVRNLYQTGVFQCAIEVFFLMRKNIVSRTTANSRIIQTYIFMACSAIILHCKQMYNTQGFWLLTPNPKVNVTDNDKQCSLHTQHTCKKYLIDGMRKYFVLGLSLDIIKMLISYVTTMRKQSKIVFKLRDFRMRTTVLLTTYIGIYRFTNCWLNRKAYYSNNWNHIISSFLSGVCYYLYPQMGLFSYALLQVIQSLWEIFKEKNNGNPNKTLKLLLAMPYGNILFPIAVGNIVHLSLMQPKYVSDFARGFVNGVTNKYASKTEKKITFYKNIFKSSH